MLLPLIEQMQQQLASRSPLQALSPDPHGQWDAALGEQIERLTEMVKVEQLDGIQEVQAGLFLWNDQLMRSHALSQELDHAIGSYWHGIMHRMEQDYSNAKYWFSQPGVAELAAEQQAAVLLEFREAIRADKLQEEAARAEVRRLAALPEWRPEALVDAVRLAERGHIGDPAFGELLQQAQQLEISGLLAVCVDRLAATV